MVNEKDTVGNAKPIKSVKKKFKSYDVRFHVGKHF